LVVDENDRVSEWAGAEDNQGGFVRWRYLDALGGKVFPTG
jgi:hypothetical protein